MSTNQPDDDDQAGPDWDHDPELKELDSGPAIVICPQCGAETDDESLRCPVCQNMLQPRQKLTRFILVALVLILIVLFLWPFLGWLLQPK